MRRLLTIENAKTIKGEELGYLTGILYLAPATESVVINTCQAIIAKYTVNNRVCTSYEDANLYWQVYGGVLMEKIDHMTPWHVLQTKPLTQEGNK